jgi:RNA-splicing ligase RtcB
LLKNVVNRSKSAALITPALAASRRSSSDHCIAVVSFSRTIAEKTRMVASYQCHHSAQGVAGWFTMGTQVNQYTNRNRKGEVRAERFSAEPKNSYYRAFGRRGTPGNVCF